MMRSSLVLLSQTTVFGSHFKSDGHDIVRLHTTCLMNVFIISHCISWLDCISAKYLADNSDSAGCTYVYFLPQVQANDQQLVL